jgi:hypothetical protein
MHQPRGQSDPIVGMHRRKSVSSPQTTHMLQRCLNRREGTRSNVQVVAYRERPVLLLQLLQCRRSQNAASWEVRCSFQGRNHVLHEAVWAPGLKRGRLVHPELPDSAAELLGCGSRDDQHRSNEQPRPPHSDQWQSTSAPSAPSSDREFDGGAGSSGHTGAEPVPLGRSRCAGSGQQGGRGQDVCSLQPAALPPWRL